MPTIIEMREEAAKLMHEARAEFDKINDKTPEAEAKEIENRFDSLMKRHGELEEKIARLRMLEEAEARALAGDPRRPAGDDAQSEARENRQAPEYREVFKKYLRSKVDGGPRLDVEERKLLMEMRAQSTGTDSEGGYTVPEGFSGEIDKAMAAWGPMWDGSIVREVITSSGNALPWPTVDDTSQTGEQKAENAAATDDASGDVVFAEKVLNAYYFDTKIVRIPWELLQDSFFNIESLMVELFGERLGRRANSELTTGDGSSKPNGIVTASAQGKVAAASNAITMDEVLDLFHSVDPAYRQSPMCRWQMNDTTLLTVKKLKDGQGNYLWQQGDVRSGEPDTLWSKPYSINQAMASPTAINNRVMIFGDHSRYVVRKVRSFGVLTLRERYAENFQVGMVGYKRFDGELINTAAVKHLAMAAA